MREIQQSEKCGDGNEGSIPFTRSNSLGAGTKVNIKCPCLGLVDSAGAAIRLNLVGRFHFKVPASGGIVVKLLADSAVSSSKSMSAVYLQSSKQHNDSTAQRLKH